jgi:hypothetical protein
MDSVLRHCKRRTPKVKIGNWKLRPVRVQTLVHADDVVLVADTDRDLQVSVTEWASTFSERGLEVNIQWKQQKLDIMEEISYLGVVKCSNGKIDAEMNNRISKANQIYCQINKTVIGKKEAQTKQKCSYIKAFMYQFLVMQQKAGQQQAKMKIG